MVIFAVLTLFVSAQEDFFIINEIVLSGNKRTKPEVITRELTFNLNDTIIKEDLEKKIERSTSNLLNTSLFNFVDITPNYEENKAYITINLEERWYYWIYPIFEQADRNLSSFIYYHDFSKINYGLAFDWLNFRGKNETLRFKIRLGYKEQYSISYQKKGIGTKRVSGTWYIAEYFRQKKSINGISENKPTYAENEKKYIKNYMNFGLGYTYRPEINYHINIGLIYQNSVYKDSTFFISNFPDHNEFITNYIVPRLKFEYDNRNSRIYPTKGVFLKISSGLHFGISEKSQNFFTFYSSAEYNTPILKNILFYKAGISYNQFFNVKANILFDQKLDFISQNIIRGYEYLYFVSPQFLNFQNTFNIKISDFRIHYLPSFLPDEFSKTYTKLYLDVFFDAAVSYNSNFFYESVNTMAGKIVYSTGIGLNLETYYDRLIQIHVAYNSYSNKIGIFVDYKTPLYKLF
jgi:outer membrane protein assembly factor BamA